MTFCIQLSLPVAESVILRVSFMGLDWYIGCKSKGSIIRRQLTDVTIRDVKNFRHDIMPCIFSINSETINAGIAISALDLYHHPRPVTMPTSAQRLMVYFSKSNTVR